VSGDKVYTILVNRNSEKELKVSLAFPGIDLTNTAASIFSAPAYSSEMEDMTLIPQTPVFQDGNYIVIIPAKGGVFFEADYAKASEPRITDTPQITATPEVTLTPVPSVTDTPLVTSEPTPILTSTPNVTLTPITATPQPTPYLQACGDIDVDGNLVLNYVDFNSFVSLYDKSCSYTTPTNACGSKIRTAMEK
jgi:hypothetical protein